METTQAPAVANGAAGSPPPPPPPADSEILRNRAVLVPLTDGDRWLRFTCNDVASIEEAFGGLRAMDETLDQMPKVALRRIFAIALGQGDSPEGIRAMGELMSLDRYAD